VQQYNWRIAGEFRELLGTNFLPFWQTQQIAIAGFNFRIYYHKYQSIGLFDFHGPNNSPLDELQDFLRDSTVSGTFRLKSAVRRRDLSLEKALCA
jgi:hypothetical protein